MLLASNIRKIYFQMKLKSVSEHKKSLSNVLKKIQIFCGLKMWSGCLLKGNVNKSPFSVFQTGNGIFNFYIKCVFRAKCLLQFISGNYGA